MLKADATKKGKALLKRMRGKGWKLHVWENLGWNYSVENGPLSVSPASRTEFFCLLSDDVRYTCGGLAMWTTDFKSSDPNKAVAHAAASARKVVNRLEKAVSFAEGLA